MKNEHNYQIDELDKKILAILTKNARIPFLEVARENATSQALLSTKGYKDCQSLVLFPGRNLTLNQKSWAIIRVLTLGFFSIMLPCSVMFHQAF
jgi:Lrp/AsnC family transcriptional regulator for asnA, asnC and gidA